MSFYIAFSIHGTNKFFVATHTATHISSLSANPFEFVTAESRRPSYDREKDGQKVLWSHLMTKKNTPLKQPHLVKQRFAELAKRGWRLVEPK